MPGIRTISCCSVVALLSCESPATHMIRLLNKVLLFHEYFCTLVVVNAVRWWFRLYAPITLGSWMCVPVAAF